MLIRNIHTFLNRSINIIMNCWYTKTRMGSGITWFGLFIFFFFYKDPGKFSEDLIKLMPKFIKIPF